MLKRVFIIILCAGLGSLAGCSLLNREIAITDVKIVTGVDEKLMPVQVTDIFPVGTTKVSCWFQWRNAKINTQVLARWHYTTDDVHILDYNFNIPKKDGMGSVMLSMPEGKALPRGSYNVGLYLGKKLIRSLDFRIE